MAKKEDIDPKKAYELERPEEFGGGTADAMGDLVPDLIARGYKVIGEYEGRSEEPSSPATNEKKAKPKKGEQ